MKLSTALLLVPSVSAWYLEVHNQIGYIADKLLTPKTKWMVGEILEPEYNGSVGRAASWADTVSRTTAKYSYGWHWISAQDDPPKNCSLHYERDCQAGNIVEMVMNMANMIRRLCRPADYQPDRDLEHLLG